MASRGTKIFAAERNTLMDTIDNCRQRWGMGRVNSKVGINTFENAGDYNNLVTWLTEIRNRRGAPQSIEPKVSRGQVITSVKLINLINQANQIRNWCVCHGSCSGSCEDNCYGACQHDCDSGCEGDSSDNGE